MSYFCIDMHRIALTRENEGTQYIKAKKGAISIQKINNALFFVSFSVVDPQFRS